MTPERPRWLDRWLQTDDDELLYVDQTMLTTSDEDALDALEHERLAQAEQRAEEARGQLRDEWERWVDTQGEEEYL